MKTATVLLLVALPLAGCIGDAGPRTVVITDPDDFSYLNETASGTTVEHIHDYWGGRDRLVVIDVPDGQSKSVARGNTHDRGFIEIAPPVGMIIPLGTSKVEITITWDDESLQVDGGGPNYRLGDEPIELWIQTAADDSAHPFTQIESGVPVAFETENRQNDIPHQTLSAWRFVLAVPLPAPTPGAGAADLPENWGSWDMDLTILVEAIRGLDIPPFPAHPDVWGEAESLPVLSVAFDEYMWASGPTSECLLCQNVPATQPWSPSDGAVIPRGSSYVEVLMENRPDMITGLKLQYHGADSREFVDAELFDKTGFVTTYRIDTHGKVDSPYALQSVWRFKVVLDSEDPAAVSRGSYDITATVHRETE